MHRHEANRYLQLNVCRKITKYMLTSNIIHVYIKYNNQVDYNTTQDNYLKEI